jgi:peptidoglycan/xylan/chitin deacetylase (PgdA/CDA1 family)
VGQLAETHGVDTTSITREAAISWHELRELAKHPLASIEAHTADHIAIAAESEAEAKADIARGVARIEAELGRRPQHFSYPYGDSQAADASSFSLLERAFDFHSATTTRKGLLTCNHRSQLHALPRLSLNGELQDARIVEVLLSGLPFALGRMVALNGVD